MSAPIQSNLRAMQLASTRSGTPSVRDADPEPLDRYTPTQGQAARPTEDPPHGGFWTGASLGAGLAGLGCLLLGVTGPFGLIVVGSAALAGGVHSRDGGISQQKLDHLEDWHHSVNGYP